MPGSARPPSERVRLARVALAGALSVPDVVRGEAGLGVTRVVTADGSERLVGVSAIAQSDGRYAIGLRLIARLVPLSALADHVRADVQAAASRAGLAALLGRIDVEFVDVLTAAEIERSIIAAELTAAAVPEPPPLTEPSSPQSPAETSPRAPKLQEGLE
ncbi:MAG TPA: hypothetical protein VIX82_02535 [Solirubrobacteraceae bacterium]